MRCLSQRQIGDYLRGSVSEAEAQTVEEHLAACEICAAALEKQDALSDILFAAFQDTEAKREQYTHEDNFHRAAELVERIPVSASIGDRPAEEAIAKADPSGPPPLPLPRTVGEYQLLQRLGSGGMGTVYKARHTRLNKIVAVKMMRESRLGDPTAVARFDREMMAVGGLDHPHIVRATDAREIDGQRLLVMEFIDGADLALLVRSVGPIPIPDACEMIRQTALGLQSAHDRGLIHRDIKPSNIMLATSGQVKVLDLGLALIQELPSSQEEVTVSGQALGTAEYISPEQLSNSHDVDLRTDVYSLGCTFYKLLTGQAPFDSPQYPSRDNKLSAHLLSTSSPSRAFWAIPSP